MTLIGIFVAIAKDDDVEPSSPKSILFAFNALFTSFPEENFTILTFTPIFFSSKSLAFAIPSSFGISCVPIVTVSTSFEEDDFDELLSFLPHPANTLPAITTAIAHAAIFFHIPFLILQISFPSHSYQSFPFHGTTRFSTNRIIPFNKIPVALIMMIPMKMMSYLK